jgi:hypothetical protein
VVSDGFEAAIAERDCGAADGIAAAVGNAHNRAVNGVELPVTCQRFKLFIKQINPEAPVVMVIPFSCGKLTCGNARAGRSAFNA